jgi:hypothetical protein
MNGPVSQFLIAFAGAIGLFLLGKLLIAGGYRAVEPGLAWLRPNFARLDHLLAVRISGWLGLDEERPRRGWLRMLGVFFGLGLVGAVAPWPVGIAALTLGLFGTLAVFRRWAWDEADRALGLRREDRRIPGGRDYSDTALAALAAVFMLSSLLVWRLTGTSLFEGPGTHSAYNAFLHMLSEVLVALPVIGNVEVMGYRDPSGVRDRKSVV